MPVKSRVEISQDFVTFSEYMNFNLNIFTGLDAFGRSKTQADGYVYFTAHGKDYLYCASTKIFTQERRTAIGEALCKHENFEGKSLKLI